MASSTFMELTNRVLISFNEVELTSSTFSSAIGFHSFVKNSVNDAIYMINSAEREWPFNHSLQEDTLTAKHTSSSYDGTHSFPSTAKVVDWESFYLQRDDNLDVAGTWLPYMDYDMFIKWYKERDDALDLSSGDISVPNFVYPTPSGGYGVTPLPNEAYTVQYHVWAYPTRLSAYTDEPTVPQEWDWVIEAYARYRGHTFRENEVMASMELESFDEGLKDMRTTLINKPTKLKSHVRVIGDHRAVGSEVLRVS